MDRIDVDYRLGLLRREAGRATALTPVPRLVPHCGVAGSRQYWVGQLHDRCENIVEPLRPIGVAATPHRSLVLAVLSGGVRMASCWVARVIAT
jgi:hypothetical protein